MICYLCDFLRIRPRYEIEQSKILPWLAERHALAAESCKAGSYEEVLADVGSKLDKIGLGKGKIQSRGVHHGDLMAKSCAEMEIYPISLEPKGKTTKDRFAYFNREASLIFEEFYPEGAPLPCQLIHVTCTGYVAPSPAQKIVTKRGAGLKTTVTHAYHMGCYGAISAIRMGAGMVALPAPLSVASVDIVHTELCTLHLQPMRNTMDQLIVESLFCDGFIKYTARAKPSGTCMRVIAVYDQMIPDSEECMTWNCEDHGMGMTLSKEVPVLIMRFLKGYLARLCFLCGVEVEEIMSNALFAVHPGGPKILQYVQEALALKPHQISYSEKILRECGNMSSATLPHIWEEILLDKDVKDGTRIVSLAFGPGLTFCGGLFEKVMS